MKYSKRKIEGILFPSIFDIRKEIEDISVKSSQIETETIVEEFYILR